MPSAVITVAGSSEPQIVHSVSPNDAITVSGGDDTERLNSGGVSGFPAAAGTPATAGVGVEMSTEFATTLSTSYEAPQFLAPLLEEMKNSLLTPPGELDALLEAVAAAPVTAVSEQIVGNWATELADQAATAED